VERRHEGVRFAAGALICVVGVAVMVGTPRG
jgi:drug/metabolite transporter superfamily protein YnfA